MALTTFGGLFMLLGVMLFFDGALLALGNVGVVLFFLSSASFLRIISFPVPFSIREPHIHIFNTFRRLFLFLPLFCFVPLSAVPLSLSLSLQEKETQKETKQN